MTDTDDPDAGEGGDPMTTGDIETSCIIDPGTLRRRPVVYQALDRHGQALYIGSTTNILSRLTKHCADAAWWDLTAWIVVADRSTIDEMARAERHLIAAIDPPFCGDGPSRRRALSARPKGNQRAKWPPSHHQAAVILDRQEATR